MPIIIVFVFIVLTSTLQVNLDATAREETRKSIDKGSPSCFNEAQKMIYILMEKDSYRRFLNSKLFQDLSQVQPDTAPEKEKKNCVCAMRRQTLTGGA